MFPISSLNFDIGEVVRDKRIETHFQPIISMRRQVILGVEALSRGIDDDGQIIPPVTLFNLAAASGRLLELDKLCRKTAAGNFLPLHRANPELILFLNVHLSAFTQEVGTMAREARELGIDPRNIALEVLESEFADLDSLREAAQIYKDQGFLVVIDDMGVGHSNLDRIAYVKPDVVKADLSLVRNIDREYHKQEVFKSLVYLTESIGGWLISEGVETEAEAVTTLKLGVDMLQGFHFARPRKAAGDHLECDWDRVHSVGAKFKEQALEKIKLTYSQQEERRAVTDAMIGWLQGVSEANFEQQLREHVLPYPVIESACVLNLNGVQITETVINRREDKMPEKTIIFRPPPKNTNHSLKEYFYVINETNIKRFETQPYIPLPSGNMCITVSTLFKNIEGAEYILCLHFIVSEHAPGKLHDTNLFMR